MLIYLIEWLDATFGLGSWTRLFQYITFRAGIAIILSLIISMLFGGKIIRLLRSLQVGEEVRDLGLAGQNSKQGTPTMGGIIIVMAILVPCWLMARLDNIYIVVMLVSTSWMTVIGFIDDYIKVFRKNKKGLRGRFKVMGQIGLGIFIALTMLDSKQIVVRLDIHEAESIGLGPAQMVGDTIRLQEADQTVVLKGDYKTNLTNVPFLKGNRLDYGHILPLAPHLAWIVFVPFVIFLVTAVSNAANLTDGLDGLATGVSGIIGITLAVFAYVSGNSIAANYLGILHLPGSGELVIYAACFLGACLGFLWYNSFPAQVFMGDTGSLMLGGVIGALAILLRKELLIPILCGIFVAENLSVMLQVGYFKYTRRKYGEGRRILLMSPLHHHYQKKGMAESKIVTRFWIVGILLAVATILTLKIR
ncbi:MAG: phospho-N-acetylmuramoyl-pentapeptide-transferase [Bacteroidetes bacterium]|nr:MAG: phospho-N-acetylmuramoyl-pentapeptide-transferase [Bacteroidota bacterium]PTM15153.1 MAG: phospho-N-acetylmuramoyl-pentapeptide-transferase [Bacteroidota bacterium]